MQGTARKDVVAWGFAGLLSILAIGEPLAEEPRTPITALPVTLSVAGSYYLVGNLSGTNGIAISVSNVTIDLNGFALVGTGSGTQKGIRVTANSLRNIIVRNGTVQNWGDDGIDLLVSGPHGVLIENVSAQNNGGHGISLAAGCRIVNSHAQQNAENGFNTGGNCVITGSTARENGGIGINTLSDAVVSDCSSVENTGSGIVVGDSSTIRNSGAHQNTLDGIVAERGSTVVHCTANENRRDGIRALGHTLVLENNCHGNVASGIHVPSSSANRIEGNNVEGVTMGIHVQFAGNVIIRNSSYSITRPYFIVPNNVIGEVVFLSFGGTLAESFSAWGNIAY